MVYKILFIKTLNVACLSIHLGLGVKFIVYLQGRKDLNNPFRLNGIYTNTPIFILIKGDCSVKWNLLPKTSHYKLNNNKRPWYSYLQILRVFGAHMVEDMSVILLFQWSRGVICASVGVLIGIKNSVSPLFHQTN